MFSSYYSPFAICTLMLHLRSCPFLCRAILVEKARRHPLTALDQARFVRTIVGDRVVDGAEVLPHQYVALLPAMHVTILGLELVREQIFEQSIALGRRQLVDL